MSSSGDHFALARVAISRHIKRPIKTNGRGLSGLFIEGEEGEGNGRRDLLVAVADVVVVVVGDGIKLTKEPLEAEICIANECEGPCKAELFFA